MRTSYFPSTDAALLGWAKNLSQRLLASGGTLGISVEQAEAFAQLYENFFEAMRGVSPGIRCKTSVVAKNDSREAMKASARLIRSILFGQAHVSDDQKIALGFNVPRGKSSINAPDSPPTLHVVETTGHTVKLRLNDSTTVGRTRPEGATAASIYTFIGEAPPEERSAWRHALSTTRHTAKITFAQSVPPGTRVWFCAYWTNPRSQPGPTSSAVGAWIQFGGSMVMANLNNAPRAIAA